MSDGSSCSMKDKKKESTMDREKQGAESTSRYGVNSAMLLMYSLS